MNPALRLACLCALALAVSGCGKHKKDEKPVSAAPGEILPHSISDDMLPYDTVRSQPPLAPQTQAPGKSAAKHAPSAAAQASAPAAPASGAAQ